MNQGTLHVPWMSGRLGGPALGLLTLALSTNAFAQDLSMAADQQAAAAAPGAVRVGPLYQGVGKQEDDRSDWDVPLQVGQCYTFSGVGGPGLKRLYLYLWDPKGKRVADIKPRGAMAVMTHCPQAGGMFHLQAKIAEGAGTYGVGVYAGAPQAPAAPPPVAPPVDLGAQVDALAASLAPGARRVAPHTHGQGGWHSYNDWFTTMQPGNCYWIIGVGAPSVKELYLYLWGPDNKRVTEAKPRSNSVSIGHCPTVPGMFKYQAKIVGGSGPYSVGVYVKPNR